MNHNWIESDGKTVCSTCSEVKVKPAVEWGLYAFAFVQAVFHLGLQGLWVIPTVLVMRWAVDRCRA